MQYDVIIAGAGPAGSTCGRSCARAGIRTLLLERDVFPRPKPCGGAVSERALRMLDLPLPPDIIEQECFGVRLHLGEHFVEARKDRRIAVMVSRERFDQWLADGAVEAGAKLRQGEAVQEIVVQPERVEVRTGQGRYEARCLVGADGANSVVARTVRQHYRRDEMASALVGSAPADDGEIAGRLDGMLELYFGAAPLGYGWVFPHRGGFGVGIMGRASDLSDPLGAFRAFAASVGLSVARPRGHTIPWGGLPRKVIGPRTLLAGDAAGFADPFHGEGIAGAVLSGKLAAQAVADGIRGEKNTLTWYQQECDRVITGEMRVALRMALMLERFPKVFLELFFRRRDGLDRYLDIPAGRSDYRRFRRWLFTHLPGAFLASLFRREKKPTRREQDFTKG